MMPGPKDKGFSFPPQPRRPANIYLVFGYEVGVPGRDIVMFQKGEEAMQAGVSVTVSADGQRFFVGIHLGTLEARDAQDCKICDLPHLQENDDLPWKLEKLGIKVDGKPRLIMVAS